MTPRATVPSLAVLLSLVAAGCGPRPAPATHDAEAGAAAPVGAEAPAGRTAGASVQAGTAGILHVSSSAFPDSGTIPTRYTCAGTATIPPLAWSGVPAGAASLALMVVDTDVPGTFVHWVAYRIPPTDAGVPEGGPPPAGSVAGVNSTGHDGYFGPCPPRGDAPHHYHFRLFALDSSFSLAPGATGKALLGAMQGHVLARGETVGTFGRR